MDCQAGHENGQISGYFCDYCYEVEKYAVLSDLETRRHCLWIVVKLKLRKKDSLCNDKNSVE